MPAPTPSREFLAWDDPRPVLERAAERLVELYGDELGEVVVALPGRRAARRLEQHLAPRLRGAAPRLVPVGHLPDELLLPARPFAGRLLRTLLWRDALRGLGSRAAPLLRRPPAAGDDGAWLALAEEVRAVHGELMRELLDFRAGIEPARRLAGEAEAARWEVLELARAAYLKALDARGLDDPHEGRREALRSDRLDGTPRVALVGVAEVSRLVRRLLDLLGTRATLLIIAPRELDEAFDAAGAVVPAAFANRPIELAEDRWQIADGPEDQARRAAAWIAERAPRLARSEVVVGVPDAEVVPHLRRRLLELDADSREARGTPLALTSPARLLAAVAAHLRAPTFASFAALLRHPELLAALRRLDTSLPDDTLARLDAWHAEHVPDLLPGHWPGLDDEDAGRRADAVCVARADAALRQLLGELLGKARPAAAWAAPLAELLGAVWPDELDEQHEDQRLVAGALQELGDTLRQLDALKDDVGELSAAETLALLLRDVERGAVPAAADPDAIELLGWLELPLDDSPALVVTGLNEGRVPASVRGHALLPDALRRELDLPDDEHRLARDAYALALLARARRELLLLCGRRGQEGDPLLPSRLLFLAAPEVALRRAARFGTDEPAVRAPEGGPLVTPPRRRPLLAREPLQRVSVTGFGAYLRSPYGFYLERVLGLERGVDDARELSPAAFGSLAHDVLAVLADPATQRLTEMERLEALLVERLRRLARARFGDTPAPAVTLQLDQLAWRLQGFAAWQARQHEQGWRVTHAEWGPREAFVFEVEGGRLQLSGRIDRIEIGPEGRWRIADYKTGDKGESAASRHGGLKGAAWKDLQLPLYELLTGTLREELERLGARGEPELGFVLLPRERLAADAWWSHATWTRADLDRALAEARRVGGAILREEFEDLGRYATRDEIVAAILGEGLLVQTDDAPEEGS
jgi:ATP-dependent helicase/nuclease subunit B